MEILQEEEVALLGQVVLNHAKSFLGMQQGDSRHQDLIKRYNKVKPLPVGYTMKLSDDWCAAFVTVIGDMAGASDYIGRECGVQRFTKLFKDKGIWLGIVEPRPGDLVVFDWQKDRWADHIGFVEKVKGNQVTTIEGNTSKRVDRRTYAYNNWRVAGYARPQYPTLDQGKKPLNNLAHEVMAGKWGNGVERSLLLKSAGYDNVVIQKEVNRIMKQQKKNLKSNEAIAKEVIQGKWGNGDTRKTRLTHAGYNYPEVQKIVNRLV